MHPPDVVDGAARAGARRHPRAWAVWEQALRQDPHADVERTVLDEAAEYFGVSADEVRQRMEAGTELLAAEWARMGIDATSERDLLRFYNENTAEAFELLHWNACGEAYAGYVAALQLAAPRPGRAYLDYGSGVGSGAILFARHGFEVTLADISTPLLDFARWRLARRGLAATFIDLKSEPLPSRRVDTITAFDVLEHLHDPLQVIRRLRGHLVERGVLVFNTPFDHDPTRPMHIFHDARISRRFRALGFAHRYGADGGGVALEKCPNPPWRRLFYRAYDDYLHGLTRRLPTGRWRRWLAGTSGTSR